MKKIAYILCVVSAIVTLNSCKESFLEVPPYGAYTPANLNDGASLVKILNGCYSAATGEYTTHMQLFRSSGQICLQNVHGGEAMKGGPSTTDLGQVHEMNAFNVTTGNTFLLDHWKWLYDAVDRCNDVLKKAPAVTDLTDAQKTQIIAEARFLRAHFYFMLKRNYGNIPWIDETTTDFKVPNTVNNDGVTYVNCWENITADMDFARKNLAATNADKGRPNKWAAEAYYAKILVTRANLGDLTSQGYTDALAILNNVMTNGVTQSGARYALATTYYTNFSAATENGPESVWAIQHSVNDGIASVMAVFGQSPKGNPEGKIFGTQAPLGPGWGSGWGFYNPSQWFVDHFRVDGKGLPYLDMYATNANSIKSDFGIESVAAFTPDTAGVDPRLDYSVGRRGIPYLDYGIEPGKSWTRNQAIGGPYIQKKFSVKDAEAGMYTPNKLNVANAINVCIIRYADVLLYAAECEARVGSLDNARALVNQVRNRMNNPGNRIKLADNTTNAATYRIGTYPAGHVAFSTSAKALDAILYERTLELGLEGHRFFDVVRFGKDVEEFTGFVNKMKETLGFMATSVYTRVPDALLPIPRTAIDNSQKAGVATLTQNPGY